jgi:hypothetical protein
LSIHILLCVFDCVTVTETATGFFVAHIPLQVKKAGLQNILALRGDPPKGQENFTKVEGGFGGALDLVKYIK